MPKITQVTAARELRLAGSEAVEFLASAGWMLTSDPEGFRYVGDLVKNDQFVVARYWHTPADFDYEVRAELHGEERLQLVAGLEGELTYFLGDHAEVVSPGRIMLARPSTFTGARCTGPVALMFIVVPGQSLSADALLAAGQASPDYLPLLLSVMNSLLAQGSVPDDAGFARVERALEELTIAVAAQSDLTFVSRIDNDDRHLYLRAITLIAAEAMNPHVTVESITAGLGVSRSALFAAFQATGDTPARYLRRARATIAVASLAEGSDEAEAARRSGFGNVRRMRAALAGESTGATSDTEGETLGR